MEGAENFDFFRQPDFLKEPLLAGSYAVYKKETLIGEGTGKLCHIHRPEIIDARGRRCWGGLAVVANELRVTIPEWFLSEAVYPVIVDPTIGTSTVGSLTKGTDPNNSGYDRPWLDSEYTVNKYLIPQSGGGLCDAYVYAYSDETDSEVYPCLYTNTNNKPYQKKSKNENAIYVIVWPAGGKPVGWRNNTFQIDGSIISGDYIWFGMYSSWFTTRFDYGGECYKGWFDWDLYPEYEGEPPPYIHIGQWDTYCTIKWSMYFTYTAAQNFVRTLTQGVKLTDNRKLTGNYKRSATQTVKINSALKRFETFFRKCVMTVNNAMNISSLPLFLRKVTEQIKVTMSKNEKMSLARKCVDDVIVNSNTERIHNVIRNIQDGLKILDTQSFSVLFVRSVDDTAMATGYFRHLGSFIRGLLGRVHATEKDTNTGQPNKCGKHNVAFVIPGPNATVRF
jgi:hypothetical protein